MGTKDTLLIVRDSIADGLHSYTVDGGQPFTVCKECAPYEGAWCTYMAGRIVRLNAPVRLQCDFCGANS